MVIKALGLTGAILDIEGRVAASLDDIHATPETAKSPAIEPDLATTFIVSSLPPKPQINSTFVPTIPPTTFTAADEIQGGQGGQGGQGSGRSTLNLAPGAVQGGSTEQSQSQGQSQSQATQNNSNVSNQSAVDALVRPVAAPTAESFRDFPPGAFSQCHRPPVDKSSWMGTVSLPFCSLSFTNSAVQENGGECVQRVRKHLAEQQIQRSGPLGETIFNASLGSYTCK